MARAGIYKSEVVRARDKLLALGRHPSIDAIRIELGNTGSKATIHRYLKEIEEEEGGTTGTKVAVSDAIQDLVGRLASRLHEEADARVNEASARSAAKAQQLTETITALKSETQSSHAQLESLQRGLADEKKGHTQTRAELNEATTECAKLAQEVRDLRERLASEELHRQSLEDKHKHARESLEHFRQSAKEQREQEARKHAQEVQFLQTELGGANKALAIKQHEAATAHKECSRLLAELAHAQSQLHGTKEEARELREQVGQLGFAQKQADEFGQRLVEQQAASAALEASNLHWKARTESLATGNQQLELKLAAAHAALEAQKSMVDSIVQRFNGGAVGDAGSKEAPNEPAAGGSKKSQIPV